MDKDLVIELFLSFVLLFLKNFIHIYHLICFYVLYSFSHPATIFNKLELSWVESSENLQLSYPTKSVGTPSCEILMSLPAALKWDRPVVVLQSRRWV